MRTETWPSPFATPSEQSYAAGSVRGHDFLVVLDRSKPAREVADGRYRLPESFDVLMLNATGSEPWCQLSLAVTPAGPVCTKLTLVGTTTDPLTATRVRVPLGDLITESVATIGAFNFETESVDREGFERALSHEIPPRPQRGKRINDEFLGVVADRYRYALRVSPDKPTEAIADAFDVSRSTAGRWLVEARKRGLLDPAAPGRAGEWTDRKEK